MIKFGEDPAMRFYMSLPLVRAGPETVFPEVVGEALGMDPEKITLRASDPTARLVGEGTIGRAR
jgi:hypothetical protein